MTIDFSEEGRKKIYEDFFEYSSNVEKQENTNENRYRLLKLRIEFLKSYERQREMYFSQIKNLWETKKSYLISSELEKKKFNGVVTNEVLKLGNKIKKSEDFLRKQSKTFDKDLEKIILSDPEVRNINVDLN